jgi:glyoxylase-like metal-dependent hydrolase (beta-lactamase superfamily II)
VIVPPGGDMKAYIESLRLLLDYPIKTIAPGHGEVISESARELQGLVEHRLKREAKVVAGLEQLGDCNLDALVRVVYDDVDESLYEWAKLSMTAHLIKLEQEGRACADNPAGTWKLSP